MTEFQISLSTAEEELNYFTGEEWLPSPVEVESLFPPGLYRVVNGQLYRILEGVPPSLSR